MTSTTQISPDWIGLDWGTSNLRAFAMRADGTVLAEARSDKGMAQLAPTEFEAVLRDVVKDWVLPEQCHVVACGMLGARQGWKEAPYRSVPCAAQNDTPVHVPCTEPDLDVWIVPGVKQASPPDVMRGEETQIAGFLALKPEWDGVICLPGTHSKWVHISAGEIVSFRTFMTGELFDVISTGTVLKHSLKSDDMDLPAFIDAMSETLSRPEKFAANLFTLRASDLLQNQSADIARAHLSGALIGMELAAAKPYWLGQNIALIGSNALCDLYKRALSEQGVTAKFWDASLITQTGLSATYATLKRKTST